MPGLPASGSFYPLPKREQAGLFRILSYALVGKRQKFFCQTNSRLRIELPEAQAPQRQMPAMSDANGALLTDEERRERDRANIRAALAACGGKIFGTDGAAALLGVKPTTLASRIKALGISRAAFAEKAGSAALHQP